MSNPRRGVLLLVVLSVLTLFLMLGATYLAVATRARKASRAFADTVVATANIRAAEMRLLDEVFLAVARGTTVPLTSGTALGAGDDLLGDKYGVDSLVGRLTGSAAAFSGSPAFIQITGSVAPVASSAGPAANVSDLAGRVVTINLPGLATSTRVIRATGSVFEPTLVIAAGPTPAAAELSVAKINAGINAAAGTAATTLIINGREFDGSSTNESYDGFDTQNPLLTRVMSGTVSAAALSGTAPLTVDNDGDGIADSGWLDLKLPPITDANGQSLTPRAAILVIDLDGRLNVNAHGSTVDLEAFDPATGRDKYPSYAPDSLRPAVPLYQIPRGVGGGPASVSLSRSGLFLSGTTDQKVFESGLRALGGGDAAQPSAPGGNDRETPVIRSAEGRYGDAPWSGSFDSIAQPGVSDSNDSISLSADQWRAKLAGSTATNYFTDPGRFGSPWDVKARMKLWVDGIGQPIYYKPSWSTAGSLNDVVDDPYEVNLSRSGVRTAYIAAPTASNLPVDNLYTPPELEGLLRFHDPDSLKLPRRLVALNQNKAANNRLVITTESWDTPAVTGTAWQPTIGTRFASLLTSATTAAPRRAQDLFAPETLVGHKMDLNRPFHDVPNYDEPNDATGIARRQSFARNVYCLMMAVMQQNGVTTSGTVARQIAQYAVNIVDWRDGDSVMTKFQFDPSFSGTNTTWTTGTSDYVWGCERPELLITETLAWHDRRTDDLDVGGKIEQRDQRTADDDFDQNRRPWGAFFVELYSPWQSTVGAYVSGTAMLASGTSSRGEPVPGALTADGLPGFGQGATVWLNKRAANSSPVWRLASVRGKVAGGTGFDSSGAIRDPAFPAASGSNAIVDRVFYFATPTVAALLNPTDPRDGQPGAVFWTTGTATAQPSRTQYVVVGTDGPQLDPRTAPLQKNDDGYSSPIAGSTTLAYTQQVHLRFDSPNSDARRPATLSEPVLTTTANVDPYEIIAENIGNQNQNKFVPDLNAQPHLYSDTIELQHPVDRPLDRFDTPITGVSPPFLTGTGTDLVENKPLLMFNGTHDNFAVIHLQRLADPNKAWDANDNPYITVDSMPVDLTVINTREGDRSQIEDESGMSPCAKDADGDVIVESGTLLPGDTALTWLRTQKAYGFGAQHEFSTTERGGKRLPLGTNVPEHDMWSRRVTSLPPAGVSAPLRPPISHPDALRTAASATRDATPLSVQGVVPNQLPKIDKLDPAPALATITLKRLTTDVAIPARWARGEFDANANGEIDPDEDPNGNGLLDPPRFAWLAWPNRPYASVIDLALVPTTSPFDLTGRHSIRLTGTAAPAFYHLPRFFEDTASAASPGTPPETPWRELAGREGTNRVSIFDFLHVPSPFAGVYTTPPAVATGTTALADLGLNVYPTNMLSSFREPGRVNVNTITNRAVWRALFGDVNVKGTLGNSVTDDPIAPTPDLRDRIPGWSDQVFMSGGGTPAKSLFDFFRNMPANGLATRPNAPRAGGFVDSFVNEDLNTNGVLDYGEDANMNGVLDSGEDADGDGILDTEDRNRNGALDLNYHRDTDRNAFFRYQTMRQLSNVVTTRSNVYAVWITIGYFDGAQEATPVRRSRAFFIFDRSIPVAYDRGKDHNVRDAILLRRIIQ